MRQGEATALLGQLQPVDPGEELLDAFDEAGGDTSLLRDLGNDRLQERDLRVLKALKTPAIELQAEYPAVGFKRGFNHLEDARLARAPIAMHTDGDRALGLAAEQGDDCFRDRLVVAQIDLRLVVGQQHRTFLRASGGTLQHGTPPRTLSRPADGIRFGIAPVWVTSRRDPGQPTQSSVTTPPHR